MIFSVIYYFLLPIGAAYFTDLFSTKLWGPINFGLVFAFSQFIVAWLIAFFWARKPVNSTPWQRRSTGMRRRS